MIIKIQDVKKGLKLAFTYTGVIIGAGFASGKELECFFVKYGVYSIVGLIGACLLFSIFFNRTLTKIYRLQSQNMTDYFCNYNTVFIRLLEVIIHLFLLSSYSIMIAASGALLNQNYGFPTYFGTTGFAILCFLVLINQSEKILFLNSIIVPILISGILFVAVFKLVGPNFFPVFNSNLYHKLTANWIVSSLVYVGYNIITVPITFMAFTRQIKNNNTIKVASITSFFFLAIPALSIWQLLYHHYGLIHNLQIPILGVLANNNFIQIFYSFLLFLAIFTTAIANGLAINQQMTIFFGIDKLKCALILTIISLILSIFPFSVLIDKLYTTFGYIGIFLFFLTVLDKN